MTLLRGPFACLHTAHMNYSTCTSTYNTSVNDLQVGPFVGFEKLKLNTCGLAIRFHNIHFTFWYESAWFCWAVAHCMVRLWCQQQSVHIHGRWTVGCQCQLTDTMYSKCHLVCAAAVAYQFSNQAVVLSVEITIQNQWNVCGLNTVSKCQL